MPKESTKATITSFAGTPLVRVVDGSNSRNISPANLVAESGARAALDSRYLPIDDPTATGDVDLTGADSVTVPDATNPTHALNLGIADARFLRPSLYLAGADYVTTPDDAAWTPSSTLDVRIAAAADTWLPAGVGNQVSLVSHYEPAGNQRSWGFWLVNSSGNPRMFFTGSTDGTALSQFTNSVDVPAADGDPIALRMTWTGSTQTIGWYSKPYTTFDDLTDGTGWSQVGVLAISGSIPASLFAPTANLSLGALSSGAIPFTGKVFGAVVKIDGSVVASPRFDVSFDGRQRDAQGNIWTLQGSTYAWDTAAHPT